MPSDVQRAIDSVGTRDFGAERAALLAQADAKRAEADAIDVASATEATLRRTAAAASEAMARGSSAADGALAKIHEQQDRFKTNVVASGGSLDDEAPAGTGRGGRALAAQDGNKAPAGNKYSMMMDRRKVTQDIERIA